MSKRKRKKRVEDDAVPGRMSVQAALEIVPEDLPDGAWMAMLCELTGLDAGGVAGELAKDAGHNDD